MRTLEHAELSGVLRMRARDAVRVGRYRSMIREAITARMVDRGRVRVYAWAAVGAVSESFPPRKAGADMDRADLAQLAADLFRWLAEEGKP